MDRQRDTRPTGQPWGARQDRCPYRTAAAWGQGGRDHETRKFLRKIATSSPPLYRQGKVRWTGHISWGQQVPPSLEPAGQAALPSLHGVSPFLLPILSIFPWGSLPWRNTELCLVKLSPPCPGPLQAPQQPHNSTRHQFYTYFCKRKVLRQSSPGKVPLTTSLIKGTAEDALHDPQITAWQNSKLGTPEIQELWCCSSNSAQHSPPVVNRNIQNSFSNCQCVGKFTFSLFTSSAVKIKIPKYFNRFHSLPRVL